MSGERPWAYREIRQSQKKMVAPKPNRLAFLLNRQSRQRVRREVVETRWLQVARIDRLGRISFLFSAEEHIPKLDVAGSSPVSRSMWLTRSSSGYL